MANLKKGAAFALTALLAASALAGCGGNSGSSTGSSGSAGSSGSGSSSTGGSTPAAATEVKFNVTTVGFGADPTGTMIQEKWLEMCGDAMGVKLNPTYQYINMNDYPDKIQIILTGGDIPDLLTLGWVPGGQADLIKYGEQGLYEDLSQNFDKLPNYKKVLDAAKFSSDPLYSTGGNMYAFYGAIYQPDGNADFAGAAAVRKDILDQHNLAIPQTVEEFTKVAQELKKIYPDKYPMIQNEEWQRPEQTLFAANHTGADVTGKTKSIYYDSATKSYVFGPATDNYKEALEVMHQWYAEGLISPDYFTQTSTDGTAAVASGEAYMIPSVWGGYPGSWAQANQYPDQKWVLIPELKNEKYGDPWAYYGSSPDEWVMQSGYSVVVGAKSKVKDQMLALMDLQYGGDVFNLLNWGIEGETYEVVNGEKKITQKYLDDGDLATQIGWGQGTCRSGIFPNPQDQTKNFAGQVKQDYFYQGKLIEQQTMAEFLIPNATDPKCVPSSILYPKPAALSNDENQEYANIMTPVETFASEQEAKFVKGDRSFDEWPKYLEELNKMGDIQKALDIYNSKLPK